MKMQIAKRLIKWYVETSWQRKITQTKYWGEYTFLGLKKKITEYHRWWGWKKQKIYIEISGDILKKK